MIYIENDFAKKVLDGKFSDIISQFEYAVDVKKKNKLCQPIKPYIRFPEEQNRIIAMPAYVGENINICGIKWIASFPKNIYKNKERANCVTIINSTETGEPLSIINSTELSSYRTASVSGMILKKYLSKNNDKKVTVGIIGYGPIGKKHEEMCYELFHKKIEKVMLFDIKKIEECNKNSKICKTWEELYDEADILITCTTSQKPYLKRSPKKGKITLNVSLRDFEINYIDVKNTIIVVDDWDEVNREKTNIEELVIKGKIKKEECIDIYDYLHSKEMTSEKAIFFNPMGMAMFDMVIAKYVYEKALKGKCNDAK